MSSLSDFSERISEYKEIVIDYIEPYIRRGGPYEESNLFFPLILIFIFLLLLFLFFGGLKFTQWYIFGHKSLFPLWFSFRNNVRNPSYFGFDNAQNIYVGGQEGKIGAWYIKTSSKEIASVLLLHDAGVNRSDVSNVSIIKKLILMGCNVLVIDYRGWLFLSILDSLLLGFADSDGNPTCDGLVDDSVRCFKWLAEFEKAKHLPHIIYGKRLGASIGIETASILSRDETPISALIIDSGFDSYKNFVKSNRSYGYLIMLPFMHRFIEDIEKSFDSTRCITKVKCDILFLHSAGDKQVPTYYAHKLFEQYVESNKIYKVKFIMFENYFTHESLLQSPQYEASITEFLKLSRPIFPGFSFFDSIRTGVYKASNFVLYITDESFLLVAKNWDVPLSAISTNWIKYFETFFDENEETKEFVIKAKDYVHNINWNEVGSSSGTVIGKVAKLLLCPGNVLNKENLNDFATIFETVKDKISVYLD